MSDNEVSLADYLKVIKNHWRVVLCAFLSLPLSVLVVSLFWPQYFQAKTSVSIGQAQEVGQESTAIKLLENSSDIQKMGSIINVIDLGDGYIQLQAQGETAEQAREHLLQAVDILIKKYEQLIQQRQVLINRQKADVDKQLVMARDWINFFQGSIKQGVPSDRGQAYALSLGAYLSRLSMLEAKQFEIERVIAVEMTQIQDEPVITVVSVMGRLKDNLFLASIAGLLLGLVMVFVKNWWQMNKSKI